MAVSFRSIIAEQKKNPEMTVRYYSISADLTAEKFATANRNHWQVENKLHWHLDVVMNKDDFKIRRGNAAELFSGIRHIGWCCQLTDLVYDGVFEVLQWLLFLSAVPPVQLLTGWCVTAKAPPDISAISALTAVKHGNCSSLTPLLNPVRTRKSLIWPWMALDAGQLPALWALASTRFYVT